MDAVFFSCFFLAVSFYLYTIYGFNFYHNDTYNRFNVIVNHYHYQSQYKGRLLLAHHKGEQVH